MWKMNCLTRCKAKLAENLNSVLFLFAFFPLFLQSFGICYCAAIGCLQTSVSAAKLAEVLFCVFPPQSMEASSNSLCLRIDPAQGGRCTSLCQLAQLKSSHEHALWHVRNALGPTLAGDLCRPRTLFRLCSKLQEDSMSRIDMQFLSILSLNVCLFFY